MRHQQLESQLRTSHAIRRLLCLLHFRVRRFICLNFPILRQRLGALGRRPGDIGGSLATFLACAAAAARKAINNRVNKLADAD